MLHRARAVILAMHERVCGQSMSSKSVGQIILSIWRESSIHMGFVIWDVNDTVNPSTAGHAGRSTLVYCMFSTYIHI